MGIEVDDRAEVPDGPVVVVRLRQGVVTEQIGAVVRDMRHGLTP
jgi:hypothetical protein